ncbi:MAG TPA: type II CAAX endopeptidase family protein [Candidatus Acidoferrum sp.]|nr:type II CAAX endopeptidase family protein [Candidatus Acidoferrum sp.]
MPATRQLGLLSMIGLWAALTLTGAMYASWQGFSGREFAATLSAFAFYFLVMLLFAARGVDDSLTARFGAGSSYLLGVAAFLVYLIYALGTNTFAFGRAGVVAGFIFAPLALAATAKQKAPGAWQDFLTLAGIWVLIKFFSKFAPPNWLFPFPGVRLAYVFTVLLCLNIALACFILLRRVNGIGYSIGWGRHWSFFVLASFIVFACIAIPLGEAIHFIQFAPHWSEWKSLPLLSLGILFFTAWPEEFLFRGLLQNMLARASKNDLAGWWTASLLFGFSHITNMHFANWKYVILASIAGFFYGWTWSKTGSIFASALVHAGVDVMWHFLFRTL